MSKLFSKAALIASAAFLVVPQLAPAVASAQPYDQGYQGDQGYGDDNGYQGDQSYGDHRYDQGYDNGYQQGYDQGGEDGPPPPPPGYDGSRPPPPPPGYNGSYESWQDQQADRAYARYAEHWAEENCVKSDRGGDIAAGAVVGGVVGAIIGSAASGPGHHGSGAAVGAVLGGTTGAALAASASTETSPGCPPGYVARQGAPAFYYSGPSYDYAAPGWYRPWVFVDGSWDFRPYPYHSWYFQHYRDWDDGRDHDRDWRDHDRDHDHDWRDHDHDRDHDWRDHDHDHDHGDWRDHDHGDWH